jgi:hypothetical protein
LWSTFPMFAFPWIALGLTKSSWAYSPCRHGGTSVGRR